MRSVLLILSLLFAVTAATGASAAEVYKWKDKNGVWHYGDRPKEGAQAVDVTPSSGTGEYSAAEMDRLAREKECQEKRAQLARWRQVGRLNALDKDGKQRELTKAERDQFLAEAEKSAEETCSRPPSPEAAGTFPPPPPAEAPPPAPSEDAPPPSRSAY
jgi:hypothetical protein